MEKIIKLNINGYEMETVLEEGINRQELVILVHGMASSRDEVGQMLKRLANVLSKNGISSVRYDQMGCGASKLSSKEATLSKARNEVLAIYDHYKALGYKRIGILGFSLGARIMAGVLDRRHFDYAISWSGAISNGLGPFKEYYDKFYDTAMRDGFVDIELSWRAPFYLSKQFFIEIINDKALDMIENYKESVLVVAGTLDTVVTHNYADDIIASCANKDSLLVSLTTDHTFGVLEGADYSNQVIDRTVEFICSHRKKN